MAYVSGNHLGSKPGGHSCAWNSDHSACGVAVDSCVEDLLGRFWAANGEYANMVSFCPHCGTKATTPPTFTPPTPR